MNYATYSCNGKPMYASTNIVSDIFREHSSFHDHLREPRSLVFKDVGKTTLLSRESNSGSAASSNLARRPGIKDTKAN